MEAETKAKQDIEISRMKRFELDKEQRRKEQLELEKRKRLLTIKEIQAKRNLMVIRSTINAIQLVYLVLTHICFLFKFLRRHFSAWYAILAEKHLKIGKIRAITDFKIKLKIWNAWRSYVRNTKAERETNAFQKSMRAIIR